MSPDPPKMFPESFLVSGFAVIRARCRVNVGPHLQVWPNREEFFIGWPQAAAYLPPEGARRRNSSKKFCRNVTCVGPFCSDATSCTTAKRLPSGARSRIPRPSFPTHSRGFAAINASPDFMDQDRNRRARNSQKS